ncbi:MAG: rRNA pseudouridine synthase [Clostridia bacterium]|nr:rRNA pseudouridine synthase [Clostridia bacterium]
MRVNKYLALCGLGSRRHVETLVTAGRVRLNGVVITDLATLIPDDATVTVDNRPVKPIADKVYILLNKPAGVVSTTYDPQGRPTVLDVLHNNPKQYATLLKSVRLYPIGRLDYHTCGLILLTNDGALTKQLTHPSTHVDKLYHATVNRPVTKSELETLSQGVKIDGVMTAPASFAYIKHDRMQIQVVIHEGRNRQIRKMFETLGIKVTHLIRLQEGKLSLGNLATGDWKFVRKSQII